MKMLVLSLLLVLSMVACGSKHSETPEPNYSKAYNIDMYHYVLVSDKGDALVVPNQLTAKMKIDWNPSRGWQALMNTNPTNNTREMCKIFLDVSYKALSGFNPNRGSADGVKAFEMFNQFVAVNKSSGTSLLEYTFETDESARQLVLVYLDKLPELKSVRALRAGDLKESSSEAYYPQDSINKYLGNAFKFKTKSPTQVKTYEVCEWAIGKAVMTIPIKDQAYAVHVILDEIDFVN